MKKRTYIWRIAIVALLCMLLISQPLLAEQAPAEDQKPETVYTDWTGDSTVFVPICTNGGKTLSFREDDMLFRVDEVVEAAEGEEAPAGRVWYSAMTSETYSELEDSSRIWKAYMQSLAAITYAGRTEARGNFIKAYSAAGDADITVKSSDNGLRFDMAFTDVGISLALEVALEDGNVVVRVPADSIREEGEYVLLTVEPLPFFGAVAKETTTDGYLVYPDGCGAISYFDRVDDKSAYALPIELDIYGTRNLEKVVEDTAGTAMLPIFGIKNADQAILAAITDGEENAKIVTSTAVETSAVPIHRSNFELWYRSEYRIYLSAASTASNSVIKKENFGVKYDAKLQAEDREVTYFLLTDDDANYSGMANAYRKHLIDNGLLKKESAAANDLFLTLFMGAEKEDAMVNAYVPMTTYDQAQEICQTLIDGGLSNLDVMLRGWSKGGYGIYPQSNKLEKQLGGKKAMKALNKFVGEHEGLTVALENELLFTGKGNDIAVKGTNVPISDLMNETFLLTPTFVDKRVQKLGKKVARFDNLSTAASTIGRIIYPDYDAKTVTNRFKAVDAFKTVMSKNQFAATQGGNQYVLASANHLYDMPAGSSLQQMTDESIPWYYMIVSGKLTYSITAGNRTGDLQVLKLKWIEYGATPTFELTYNRSLDLYGTTYNDLFSSEFGQWKDRLIEISNEFSTALADVKGQSIVKHESVGDEQICVTYENGYRVVLNYADEDFTFNGQTVSGENYVVLAPSN